MSLSNVLNEDFPHVIVQLFSYLHFLTIQIMIYSPAKDLIVIQRRYGYISRKLE